MKKKGGKYQYNQKEDTWNLRVSSIDLSTCVLRADFNHLETLIRKAMSIALGLFCLS